MAIDPNDFDVPVKDYACSEVTNPSSLIDQMAKAGGFTATKLATARDILQLAFFPCMPLCYWNSLLLH